MTDKFTKAARGKPCMYRGPTCNRDEATTVLCHIRRAGLGGVGMKPPSVVGFWGCSNCHALYDRRENALPGWDQFDLEIWAFHALCRTLDQLHRDGLI